MSNTINMFEGLEFDENDSIASILDAVLFASGSRKLYVRGICSDWIMTIGDENLQDGIRELPPIEQDILKLFFFDCKSLADIATDLDLPPELVCGHIKALRVRLMNYV